MDLLGALPSLGGNHAGEFCESLAYATNTSAILHEKVLGNSITKVFLKLSEVGFFKHINKICYNRVLLGNNTSIVNASAQKENHFKSIERYLKRQGVNDFKCISCNELVSSRLYRFLRN